MIAVYVLITILLGFVIGFLMAARRFPSSEVRRLMKTFTSEGFEQGQWKHFRDLVDHNLQVIVKPNCETLYSTTFINLNQGDFELVVPPSSEYFSVCFLNQKTETTQIITNKDISNTDQTRFILTANPNGQDSSVNLGSGICWIIARFGLNSASDLQQIHSLQDQLKIHVK